MKKFLCLFERPLEIQKNGVFLFEISFFVLEILTFFYYAVMTSYGLQQKCGKFWINDISGNIEAVFLKLGIINVHHKRNKMTPLVLLPWQQFCRWWCVNKNRNSKFCHKTETIYPTQSYDGNEDNIGTMSVPSRTLCLTLEVRNGDI